MSFRVCFVSSEVAPFAKTGGLGDVAAALPRQLAREGHDVRVVMPLYRRIAESGFAFEPVSGLREIPLDLGSVEVRLAVKSAPLPASDARVFFLEYPGFSDGTELYGHPSDHQRFAVLSHGGLRLCQWLQWRPDIVHCNDWHAALIPLLLKKLYAWDELFRRTRTVLTIHNIGYQGVFSSDTIDELGLADLRKWFHQRDLAAGRINFLRTGLQYADALTTVSATYAREIQTAEYGMGLEDMLQGGDRAVHGIVNGVDYGEWSPETDAWIPHRYSSADVSGKKVNKQALLERFDLGAAEQWPVFGIVSRLTMQKGFDLLYDILPVLLRRHDMTLCVLGAGEARYEQYFARLQQSFAGRVGFQCGYDNGLAHLIEAGSDLFLMPSRYEPCGLNQMYSLKYGTIPVVRKTGGLADTVRSWDPTSRTGTGFMFDEFRPEALMAAIEEALRTYADAAAWQELMQNAMAENWGWARQCGHYVAVYRELVASATRH